MAQESEFLTFVISVAPAIIIAGIAGELYRSYREKKDVKKGMIKKEKKHTAIIIVSFMFVFICITSIFIPGEEQYLIKVLVMLGIEMVLLITWMWASFFLKYLENKKKITQITMN